MSELFLFLEYQQRELLCSRSEDRRENVEIKESSSSARHTHRIHTHAHMHTLVHHAGCYSLRLPPPQLRAAHSHSDGLSSKSLFVLVILAAKANELSIRFHTVKTIKMCGT